MKKPKHNIREKTYLQIYQRNEKSIKLFMLLAILVFLAGFAGVISNILFEKPTFLFLTLSNSLIFMLAGLINILLLVKSLQDKRFHISWNEKEINFLLPKQKELEHLNISDIKTIIMNDMEINIILNNNEEKKINLNLIFLPQRDTVRSFFESLKKENERRS